MRTSKSAQMRIFPLGFFVTTMGAAHSDTSIEVKIEHFS